MKKHTNNGFGIISYCGIVTGLETFVFKETQATCLDCLIISLQKPKSYRLCSKKEIKQKIEEIQKLNKFSKNMKTLLS